MRCNRLRIASAVMCMCGYSVMFPGASEWDGTQLVQMSGVQQIISILMNILHSVKCQIVFT